jgi:hypothetical protein
MSNQISDPKNPSSINKFFTSTRKSIFYHPVNFLNIEYNQNFESLVKKFTFFLTSRFITNNIKNKKLKAFLSILSFVFVVGFGIFEIVLKLLHYIKQLNVSEVDVSKSFCRKCEEIYTKYIDVEDYFSYMNLNADNSESMNFLLTNPNCENIKILDYYDIETQQKINPNDLDEKIPNVGIVVRIENNYYIIVLNAFKFKNAYNITKSVLYGEGNRLEKEMVSKLNILISEEYYKTLNLENFVLFVQNFWGTINTKPRCSEIKYNINQYDTDLLMREIDKVLSNGKKRSWAFVGRPGTGKSQILKVIESKMRKYKVFHLSAKDFEKECLVDVLNLIRTFQPLILMIEDIDACDLSKKSKNVGEFINWLDESSLKNIVILVTINDTSLVHKTILRPGRIDKIEEITSPKTIEEVYEVLMSKLKVSLIDYKIDLDMNDFSFENLKELLKIILTKNYTQSEIANSIVEQVLLDYTQDKSVIELFKEAIEKLEKSKAALEKYKLYEEPPKIETDDKYLKT